jgi:hypothetical protein
MRLLLVSHFFPPHHAAGTEIYTLGLAKALRQNGHEVEVLCAEDWIGEEKHWNGVSSELYSPGSSHGSNTWSTGII